MFINTQADYTQTEKNCQSTFEFEQYFKAYQSKLLYSYIQFSFFNVNSRTEYSTSIRREINPAPQNLKKSMFQTSSRGISKALSRL